MPQPVSKNFESFEDAIQQMRAMTKHAGQTAWAQLMNEVADYLEATQTPSRS